MSPSGAVRLAIVPVFDASGAFADNADQLHVVIQRTSDAFVVKDTVLTIDPTTGAVDGNLSVVILSSPQQFTILLQAVRSADGAVLFSGQSVVSVSSGGAAPSTAQIPVAYTGPKGTQVRIAPRDTSVLAGAVFAFRASVTDAANLPVAAPVTYALVTPGDSVTLKVNRLTGAAVAAVGASGVVRVYASSPDNLRDTTSVAVGTVAPPAVAALVVSPGLAAVAAGSTTPLTAAALDATGATVTGASVTWTSRTPAVATVNGSGVVAGVSTGTAVIVAQSGSVGDSTLVVVPVAGNVVASTTAGTGLRVFQTQKVGDTVVVTLTTDMRFTPSEKLGAYDATLTWGSSLLQFIDVQAGPVFAGPVVNSTAAASGTLQLSGADASSNAVGQVVIAKVRFKALAAGAATPTLVFKDMSGQLQGGTSTVLDTRITVTNGTVTIVP